MSTEPKEVIEAIELYAYCAKIDFDSFNSACSGWWHRPFSSEELDAHPDSERIKATVEAAVRDVIEYACSMASARFADGDGAGE
jgi:hypothetical protein